MRIVALLFALLMVVGSAPAAMAHDGDNKLRVQLSGYEETPLTLSTPGSGQFKARIRDHDTAIEFELSYQDLESTVTQAHIHLGRPAITGGIVLFLCTNLGNAPTNVPTPQACRPAPATISGRLTAADVVAQAAQGIASGEFAEVIRAIRAGATYANVHTTGRPGGEIRGRIPGSDDED